MVMLSTCIAALAQRQDKREDFRVVAFPGLADGETSPVWRTIADDAAHEILLAVATNADVAEAMTLRALLAELGDLQVTRDDFRVELTAVEPNEMPDQEAASMLRIDYPVLGLSINETQRLVVFSWRP